MDKIITKMIFENSTFSFKDLNNKILKLCYNNTIDGEILVGKDVSDNKTYLLYLNLKKEK